MKFTIAAVLLAQVFPSIAGGLFMNTPLADIETCDPLSSDVHIGRSSCDAGYECVPDEASGLGGICITSEDARELRAALREARVLEDAMNGNMTDDDAVTNNVTVSPTGPVGTVPPTGTIPNPTAEPTSGSAALLSTGAVVSMMGFVAAVVLN